MESEETHLKPEAKLTYHHQVQALMVRYDKLVHQVQYLHMAGAHNWEELKTNLENDITLFEKELEALRAVADEARFDALSWGRGMGQEHLVDSIGWAEGVGHDPSVASIGWTEGVAKKHEIDPHSIGWAEGQAHKDDEE